MFRTLTRRHLLALAAATGFATAALTGPSAALAADKPFITVASTTSTEASGLFKHLLPAFTARTGIEVRVVAQGTGQALQTAKDGNADVVFVHDKKAELEFVAQGFGVKRQDVMYNDFILAGPKADPAGIKGGKDIVAAMKTIAGKSAPFASRGDDSGTDRAEKRFWKEAGVAPKGDWYRELGAGMGQTLNTAAAMDAYTLSDRGTWLSFTNRQNLEIVVQGDPRLFNQYGVILVNPGRHPTVKAKEGQAFIDWLVSKDGQAAIADYKVGGEQLFFPNAASGS
ncbi:substrate-binding domain-containing protein [Oleisolibacter albus]|uniref:substrate-binding domain-containing protein n=1 Tax=Oleisolibacter albus TaxID=2171757 RepID=UPI000DF119F4|nr:substrate-binding domain-containing protein [Oleisolibacter albus]